MKNNPSMPQRYRQVFLQWLATLLPVVAVVGSALFVFRSAVVSSIASTPHPELVYAILGAFFVGVLLTCDALWRYTTEGNLIVRWEASAAHERAALVAARPRSYLQPIYHILLGRREVSGSVRQSILEQEMGNIKAHLDDRLALPHYLAGGLVGLGLVGTFVGLLGTLDDLGKLFGALANTDNNANANPADLFADMVRRLQDPMRGMGTAFVASLYGLLGSLVLGLQILMVGRIGHDLNSDMHNLLREDRAEPQTASDNIPVLTQMLPQTASSDPALVSALQSLVQGLAREQESRREHNQKAQAEQSAVMQALLEQMREQHDRQMQTSLAALNEQSQVWEQASLGLRQQIERNQQDTQVLRSEIHSLVEATHTLAQAMRHKLDVEEQFRRNLPRTSYWQDAWSKVQQYLQRSGAEHAMANMAREQTRTLQQMAQTLRQLEQRMTDTAKDR